MNYGREYFERIYNASREGELISKARAEILFEKVASLRRVLDVGCGFGDFLSSVQKRGAKISGVDISGYALAQARRRVHGVLKKVDVARQRLPFKNDWFDAITIFDVVEHLHSPMFLFSEAFRVLRPGGVLFITTPNHQGWLRSVTTRIFPDDPTHVNVRASRYWAKRLFEAGFRDLRVQGAILHGLPPLPGVRRTLEQWNFPVFRGPLFFPFKKLCGTLYIFGNKPYQSF